MKKSKKAALATAAAVEPGPERAAASGKLKRSAYEQELEKLHGELVSLQRWVVRGLIDSSK